ncbi:extracellular solute-binding protein [Actinopolymorpha sp. B11F2]|uniref:ABC transporter substrate-binding protein n=1 Tax=Actinopolymorpha sp. B11F2 TaxID=3160862 RepID=UPI0032E396B8
MRRKVAGMSLAVGLVASVGLGSAVAAAPAAGEVACTEVPNRYNQPFSVCDDELFIFAANYKPFESSADETRQAERFFDTVIGEKLRAAFPDVKIKYATWDFPIRYENLKSAGVVPDIILENPRNRIDRDLEPLGWVQDMTGMVEQGGLDLGSLNASAVELVKSRSDGGLYGVPVFIDDYVMFYNKKIFDKFGVKYPEPGMTYDEIYKVATKLTRQDGLDAYKGFLQHPDNYLEFNQLGLYPFAPTDSEEPAPEDVKVDITSPEWFRLGENMDRFLHIPRNTFTTVDDYLKADMSRPGRVAMAVDSLRKLPMYAGSELFIDDGDEEEFARWSDSIDIGVSAVPVFGKGSEATYQPNTLAAFITPQSDRQAEALEIVKWLISEEAQVELSRHAIKGVLETDPVVSAFGEAVPELAGIDTSAVYWGENAMVQGHENTEYWDIPMYMVFRQHVLKDGMAVDSSLIVAETEDIPAYIRSKAEAGQDW